MAERDTEIGFCSYWISLGILIGLMLVMIMLLFGDRARSHDHGMPVQWMEGLHSKRAPCCNGQDDNVVEWTTTDRQKCKQTSTGGYSDNNKGSYCILVDGTWWLVPESAVLEGSMNKDGIARWWGYPTIGEGGKASDIYIRCFLPGTES
jgi:hypothetical protein